MVCTVLLYLDDMITKDQPQLSLIVCLTGRSHPFDQTECYTTRFPGIITWFDDDAICSSPINLDSFSPNSKSSLLRFQVYIVSQLCPVFKSNKNARVLYPGHAVVAYKAISLDLISKNLLSMRETDCWMSTIHPFKAFARNVLRIFR